MKKMFFFTVLFLTCSSYAGAREPMQSPPARTSTTTPARDDAELVFLAVNEGGARIYRADAQSCKKITAMSAPFAEAISVKYKVPAYRLKMLEVQMQTDQPLCLLKVDTPAGLKNCVIGSVIRTFGGQFLAHTYAQAEDGSVRFLSGECREQAPLMP